MRQVIFLKRPIIPCLQKEVLSVYFPFVTQNIKKMWISWLKFNEINEQLHQGSSLWKYFCFKLWVYGSKEYDDYWFPLVKLLWFLGKLISANVNTIKKGKRYLSITVKIVLIAHTPWKGLCGTLEVLQTAPWELLLSACCRFLFTRCFPLQCGVRGLQSLAPEVTCMVPSSVLLQSAVHLPATPHHTPGFT